MMAPVPLPEKSLIAEIRRAAKSSYSRIRLGIGDDCAVLRPHPDHELIVTTDFSLEGVHFRRGWHSPESAGHRCLARGLSDIAAMGGEPIAAFLSLALPGDLSQSWARRFVRSVIHLAEEFRAQLAGGDTAQSPDGILADIVVIGSVPKGKAVLRSGARPGHRIFVTGSLGGSAAAVVLLESNPKKQLNPAQYPRHFFPEPRIKVGQILRERGLATAMIDTSDGLSTDLAHICDESGVGALIDAESIPRARVGKSSRLVDLNLALHGGEDYELLFTVPATKKMPKQIAGVTVAEIGRIRQTRGMVLCYSNGIHRRLEPGGWEHFHSKP